MNPNHIQLIEQVFEYEKLKTQKLKIRTSNFSLYFQSIEIKIEVYLLSIEIKIEVYVSFTFCTALPQTVVQHSCKQSNGTAQLQTIKWYGSAANSYWFLLLFHIILLFISKESLHGSAASKLTHTAQPQVREVAVSCYHLVYF